jgi:acyl carrier protein
MAEENPDDLANRVRRVIADCLGKTLEEVTPEASFEDLEADSLDQVEIIMTLEVEFDIEIPDSDIRDDGMTVADAIKAVEKANG